MTAVGGTVTTSATGENQFLPTMLSGEALREFEIIAGQVGSMDNTHLKQIKGGFT